MSGSACAFTSSLPGRVCNQTGGIKASSRYRCYHELRWQRITGGHARQIDMLTLRNVVGRDRSPVGPCRQLHCSDLHVMARPVIVGPCMYRLANLRSGSNARPQHAATIYMHVMHNMGQRIRQSLHTSKRRVSELGLILVSTYHRECHQDKKRECSNEMPDSSSLLRSTTGIRQKSWCSSIRLGHVDKNRAELQQKL